MDRLEDYASALVAGSFFLAISSILVGASAFIWIEIYKVLFS